MGVEAKNNQFISDEQTQRLVLDDYVLPSRNATCLILYPVEVYIVNISSRWSINNEMIPNRTSTCHLVLLVGGL